MARRTLASKYEAYDAAQSLQRQILCYNKDAKEIYYDVEPVEEDAPAETSAAPASSGAPAAAAAAAPTAVSAPAPSAGPAAQLDDAPVQATDVVRAIIAQKLKKPFGEIPLSKAIKDLVNGKSTLQNEILGGESINPNPSLLPLR
jgi:fatty acid synthase subunit alpha